MNSGKTTTVASIVRGLTAAGLDVAAGKVTGTGAGGDPGLYRDSGAARVLDFTDFGLASTYLLQLAEVRALLEGLHRELSSDRPDAVVLEIADGLLQAETARLVCDSAFGRYVDSVVFTSREAMGALAGTAMLRQHGLNVAAVGGVLTSSPLATGRQRSPGRAGPRPHGARRPVAGVVPAAVARSAAAEHPCRCTGRSLRTPPASQRCGAARDDDTWPSSSASGWGRRWWQGWEFAWSCRSLDRTTSTHRGCSWRSCWPPPWWSACCGWSERVVSEQLSQSYVHEIRVGLVRHNLGEDGVRSLGVAVARATNDLSSVKTWVAQGVAPLAVDIPLLMGAWCVLLLLDPVLGLALLAPMAVLLIGLRASRRSPTTAAGAYDGPVAGWPPRSRTRSSPRRPSGRAVAPCGSCTTSNG